MKTQAEMQEVTMNRYGLRNWAVYDGNGEMVRVTVYKKGAAEVVRRLSQQAVSVGLDISQGLDEWKGEKR